MLASFTVFLEGLDAFVCDNRKVTRKTANNHLTYKYQHSQNIVTDTAIKVAGLARHF